MLENAPNQISQNRIDNHKEKSIPIPEKIQISHYDNLRKLIDDVKGPIAVANCICRQSKYILGQPCAQTDLRETCLMIAPDHAKRHVDMKIGRYITKEEALTILEKAQEAGLILQPENAQKPEAICCCCGDCCILLKSLSKHPRPAELYKTNFFIELVPENCVGCQECVERCQLNAREMIDGVAAVNRDRCIGCGNCVVTCEYNANRLVKKEPEAIPPEDKEALNMAILSTKVGRWRMQMIKMKMLLGLKA
jgi:NAD-dependent dihydropyrimidine dehydrogenase PreA subunit